MCGALRGETEAPSLGLCIPLGCRTRASPPTPQFSAYGSQPWGSQHALGAPGKMNERAGRGAAEGAGRGRAGQFRRSPAPRPAPVPQLQAPPRPAPPLPPQAAAERSRCRSRCPRGGGGAASPEPTPARPALSASASRAGGGGGGCGRARGARAAPSPSPPGPAPRRVHEVDATLLHLEGRTYGRGRCAGCGQGRAPAGGRAGGGNASGRPGERGHGRGPGRVAAEAGSAARPRPCLLGDELALPEPAGPSLTRSHPVSPSSARRGGPLLPFIPACPIPRPKTTPEESQALPARPRPPSACLAHPGLALGPPLILSLSRPGRKRCWGSRSPGSELPAPLRDLEPGATCQASVSPS